MLEDGGMADHGATLAAAQTRTRINFLAVLVCAILYYAIESAWFTVLGKAWLNALGKSLPQIMNELSGRPTWPLYAGAFVCNLILVWVMAWIFSSAGVRTAASGVKWAAMLWLGLVATVTITNYSFELRNLTLMAIDSGCPLVAMLVAGAILGAWTKPA
jgi:Protein of unknown function (DUF1761)